MGQVGRKVLVVEDDEVYREAVIRALRRAGYAAEGADGLASVEAHLDLDIPDLAVVDLKLGEGSGIDVVQALVGDVPTCKVLMLSGHGTVPAAVEVMRAGAVDFLMKPVSMAELVRALEAAERVVVPVATGGSLDAVEREHILRTLEAAGGNVTETARRLGLHRRTLQRKLNKL